MTTSTRKPYQSSGKGFSCFRHKLAPSRQSFFIFSLPLHHMLQAIANKKDLLLFSCKRMFVKSFIKIPQNTSLGNTQSDFSAEYYAMTWFNSFFLAYATSLTEIPDILRRILKFQTTSNSSRPGTDTSRRQHNSNRIREQAKIPSPTKLEGKKENTDNLSNSETLVVRLTRSRKKQWAVSWASSRQA